MHTPVSIVICGPYARCLSLANACTAAGIHPTLLLPAEAGGDELSGNEMHTTTDPFSCVGDMVVDLSDDDPETVIARYNQLSEINHGDVVFALNIDMPALEKVAERIMHPGRVIGLRWITPEGGSPQLLSTSFTSKATHETAFLFLGSLRSNRLP